MGEFVRPDEFFTINGDNGDGVKSWLVNAKYDRVDHVPRLGHWMLKIYDDEDGLATLHIDEETAMRVIAYSDLPVCTRTFLYHSEHEGYLQAQQRMMDGWTI